MGTEPQQLQLTLLRVYFYAALLYQLCKTNLLLKACLSCYFYNMWKILLVYFSPHICLNKLLQQSFQTKKLSFCLVSSHGNIGIEPQLFLLLFLRSYMIAHIHLLVPTFFPIWTGSCISEYFIVALIG